MSDMLRVKHLAEFLGIPSSRAPRFVEHIEHIRLGAGKRPQIRIPRRVAEELKASPERVAHILRLVGQRESARVYKYKYGVTIEQRDAMLANQGGKCPICSRSMERFGTKNHEACVDHCHSSGAVRGILCNRCNLLLGSAGDDAGVLERAAEYLKQRV